MLLGEGMGVKVQSSRILHLFQSIEFWSILKVGKQSEMHQKGGAWLNSLQEVAELLHVPWDKVAHGLIFGGITLTFGLSANGRQCWLILLFMTALAAFGELRQLFPPGRTARFGDFTTDILTIITILWVILP
jgi:VanZ family protein